MTRPSLTSSDFALFYQAVHGEPPYPWQERLARQVIDTGRWPSLIEMPAAAGRSALVDIAMFALAATPATAPRRVVYVVAHRTVDHHAYRHAHRLSAALASPVGRLLRRVANQLAATCGQPPLTVAALSGVRRPDTAVVAVATIDEFGSRLLFRGYGIPPAMRPVAAGLAGNDCLVLFDEAYQARALIQTLRQADTAQPHTDGLPRRYQIVEIRSDTDELPPHDTFRLDDDDLAHQSLGRRLRTPKEAYVRPFPWGLPHRTIPAETLRILEGLDSTERTVGVIVNQVRTARATHRQLTRAGYTARLLTARMRPHDQLPVVEAVTAATTRLDTDHPAPVVVVATQCVEVGSDYSFDAVVTEVAPIHSLRQRFGRLARTGPLPKPARAWILGPDQPRTLTRFADDPVYGAATSDAWAQLLAATNNGAQPLDVSPLAASALPADTDAFDTDAPLLLPHYLDAWAQTNPAPAMEPPIDRALHGIPAQPGQRAADVGIVWRYDNSPDGLHAVPIRHAETLTVPWQAAVAWLQRTRQTPVSDGGTETTAPALDASTDPADGWVRWAGHATPPEQITPADITPGDLLIVHPTRGGLSDRSWDPTATAAVTDLGDAAQHTHRSRYTLRLDQRVLPQTPPPPSPTDDDPVPDTERINDWLDSIPPHPDVPAWLADTAHALRDPTRRIRRIDAEPDPYFVVAVGPATDADTVDGSDQADTTTGTGAPLRTHLAEVASRTRRYAERLQLGPTLQADLETAARLHDIGKADHRYQKQLVGGDEVLLAFLEEPYATSLPATRQHPDRWPPIPHEIVSVLMAETSAAVGDAHDPDLVLYLIGNHHGRARALPLLQADPEPCTVTYGKHYTTHTSDAGPALSVAMTERFWQLTRTWGHHGLAWIETILRLAAQPQATTPR